MAGPSRRRKAARKGFGLGSRLRRVAAAVPVGAAWRACLVVLALTVAFGLGYLLGRNEVASFDQRRVTEARTAPPVARPAPPQAVAAPARPQPRAAVSDPAQAPPPRSEPPPRPAAPVEAAPAEPATLAWQRHAVPVQVPAGRPMIALVFDDLGVNRRQTRKTIELPGPLTLSFMTYADDLPRLTAAARAAGHELMLHMPMEPTETRVSPGPQALLSGLDREELSRRITWGLNRFDGYVGINNHMGSRFTRDERGMAAVMAQLKERGVLFLDSLTTPDSVGGAMAARFAVPHVARDVFLDHVQDRDHVRRSLARLEERARAKGYAIGIGHPHEETLEAVRPWLADLEARGFALVPVSAILRRIQGSPSGSRREAARPPTTVLR